MTRAPKRDRRDAAWAFLPTRTAGAAMAAGVALAAILTVTAC